MRVADYPAGDGAGWARVDGWFARTLLPPDPALQAVLAANAAAGLPPHDVSPLQGQFLALLVAISGASRVLEIGTLGGYSTIWMARALPPGGRIVTIEADPAHAAVARANLSTAGVAGQVDLRQGQALEVLAGLRGPFDLVFIDADKPNNPAYLAAALRLSRPGTVILADNVVRGGAVADDGSADPSVQGVQACLRAAATDPRIVVTALQTAGEKGWDGFALMRVTA